MMKIMVIGIDGLDPEYLLGEKQVTEKLINFHRMMEVGCFGRLEAGDGSGVDEREYFRGLALWKDQQMIIPSFDRKDRDFGDLTSVKADIQSHMIQSVDEIVAALPIESWTLLEYTDTGLMHLLD